MHLYAYGGRNFGFELPPSLPGDIADIGLSLSLDVYPYSPRWQ